MNGLGQTQAHRTPSPHLGTMSGLAGGRSGAAAATAAAPLLAPAATGPAGFPTAAAPALPAMPLALAGDAAGQLTVLPLGPAALPLAAAGALELPTRARLAAGSLCGGWASAWEAMLPLGPGPAHAAGQLGQIAP